MVLEPVISHWLEGRLGTPPGLSWLWLITEWVVLVFGLLVTFETILYLAPCGERPPLRLVTMGSVVAIVIWLAASIGFAFYTANLGSYNKAWGSLAGVIITLTWLWLTSLALVLGAEVNAAIGRSREDAAGLRRRAGRTSMRVAAIAAPSMSMVRSPITSRYAPRPVAWDA